MNEVARIAVVLVDIDLCDSNEACRSREARASDAILEVGVVMKLSRVNARGAWIWVFEVNDVLGIDPLIGGT